MDTSDKILRGPVPQESLSKLSLGRIIFDSLQDQSDQEALVDAATNNYLTCKDLLNGTVSLAKKFQSLGYRQNDTVAIASENVIEYCIPAISGLYLGMIVAPLNPGYTLREHLHAMNVSRPKIIICSPTLVPLMKEIQSTLDFIELIISFGEDAQGSYVPILTEFMEENVDTDDFKPVDLNADEQVATILCSSGTTGLPKGVMTSHRNIIPAIEQLSDPNYGNLRANDVVLGLLPFFHVYGFTLQLVCIVLKVKFVVIKKFEAELFLSSIQKYQVTNLYLVPPLMSLLANHPLVDKYNLTSIKDIICGAAPLGKQTEMSVMKRLNLGCIRQAYGMTESTFGICISSPQDRNKFGSSGKLVPRTEARIRDLNTNENLGPNKKGEICIRSPMIMMGYKNDKRATESTVINGWLHTGDVAYYDEDGYFYIVDRIKELIKYKGFQVPPAELESIILMHSAVKDCAVIAKQDERAGEIPVAFVVRHPNADVMEKDLVKHVADHISVEKRLYGGVLFVDEIPKTASGKILRRKLKELLEPQVFAA